MNEAAEREFIFTDRDFGKIASLIHSRVGIRLPPQKMDMVYARLSRRLRALGLARFKDYLHLLEDEGDELENLVNALTTNVTNFFREGHHFEHLAHTVLPWVFEENAKAKRARFWSAGCSVGMEAYSMAMTIADALTKRPGWDAKILATDIDTNVLAAGRLGRYDGSQLEKIPTRFAERYIQEETRGGAIRVAQPIRDMVRFNQLNLLEDWPMKGKFDAVFCRNVVIYFDKPTQVALFERFADILKPHGWLYVGHSENLLHVADIFEPVGKTIYRRR